VLKEESYEMREGGGRMWMWMWHTHRGRFPFGFVVVLNKFRNFYLRFGGR